MKKVKVNGKRVFEVLGVIVRGRNGKISVYAADVCEPVPDDTPIKM